MLLEMKGVIPSTMYINSETEQIILGSLCGDGSVIKDKDNTNYRFKETHSIQQKDYVLWKKEKIAEHFKVSDWTFLSNSGWSKGRYYTDIRSYSNPYFTNLRNLFYPNGKKQITTDILKNLDWLGIAVWFVDDGHYGYRTNLISIACKTSAHQDIMPFFDSLGFHPTDMGKEFIFSKDESIEFISKIKPFVLNMPECVHYKIGLDENKRAEAKIKNDEYQLSYYRKNREQNLKKAKEYRRKNTIALQEWHKQHYQKNKQIILEQQKIYRLKNIEKIKKYGKEHYQKNKQTQKANSK